MELKTKNQEQRIIKNVVAACKGINQMNKQGYDFLYLSSGFIAHYNLYGFMDYYSDAGSLEKDILLNQKWNQWDNFHSGERDYAYYMQKKNIYNQICGQLLKEEFDFIADHFQVHKVGF